MKVKTLIEFSGVPKGTVGTIEKDDKLWKVSWDGIERFGVTKSGKFGKKNLEDWFDDGERKKYLVNVN